MQAYAGNESSVLKKCVVFTDFAGNEEAPPPARGVLAYTSASRDDCMLNDFGVIETDYNFGAQSSYYVSLGTDFDQTRLYLGAYASMNVTDYNKGTIFEIVL